MNFAGNKTRASVWKALLAQLHPVLESVTDVEIDPIGRFVPIKVTLSYNRVLSVFASSGHKTRKQLVKGSFFEGTKNYMEKNAREMKTKFYLETLVLLWMKYKGMMEIKHKDFIDIVPKFQYIQGLH